jgi:hypothetical protein
MQVISYACSAYSDETVQLFRLIPTSGSEDNRPVIPKQSGQVIGAKRRWCFVISQSFYLESRVNVIFAWTLLSN